MKNMNLKKMMKMFNINQFKMLLVHLKKPMKMKNMN
jgi:hypothetical protein